MGQVGGSKFTVEEEDDDASSEGEDMFGNEDFGGSDAGDFEERIPSNPPFNPLAIITFTGYSF